MENVTEMTREEIEREMYENKNIDVINGVINGSIKEKVVTEEQQEEVTNEEGVQVEGQDENSPQNKEQHEESNEENGQEEIDELERAKRYNEFLKQQQEEIKKREAEERKRILREKEEERKRREELEKELQMLKERAYNKPQSPTTLDDEASDDEEYASEYSRKTRQMIEEIKDSIGNNAMQDPRVMEFIRKQEEKERQEEYKRAERKQMDEIERFQTRYSELKTEKPIAEIHKEYISFAEELASAMNLKNQAQIDKAVSDYYKGGDSKNIADKYGISAPKEYEKYRVIVDLIDLKRGVEYNPYTGQEEPILDEDGHRVRYRSIDEAYKVSNYYNDINKHVINAHKTMQKKLNEINSGPVVLDDTEASQPERQSTVDGDRELLSLDPRIYEKDPELKSKVHAAYKRIGIEPPKYRGR